MYRKGKNSGVGEVGGGGVQALPDRLPALHIHPVHKYSNVNPYDKVNSVRLKQSTGCFSLCLPLPRQTILALTTNREIIVDYGNVLQ